MLHALAEIGANAIQMEEPRFGDSETSKDVSTGSLVSRIIITRNCLCPRDLGSPLIV